MKMHRRWNVQGRKSEARSGRRGVAEPKTQKTKGKNIHPQMTKFEQIKAFQRQALGKR